MRKIRLGVLLIILSWLPIAQVIIVIAQHHHYLTSNDAAEIFRLSVWGVQVIIGLIGVWLVGKKAVQASREDGWRKAPAHLWDIFWNG